MMTKEMKIREFGWVMKAIGQVLIAGLMLGSPWAASMNIPDPPEFMTAAQKKPLIAYRAALADSEEEFVVQVGGVNEKYIAALERAKDYMLKIRAERAATALGAEILRIRLGETERSKELDAAPDNVRKMRTQYDQLIVRLNRLKHSRDATSRFEVDEQLAIVQSDLTKANDLDNALAVRQFRQDLINPPKPKPEIVESDPPEPRVSNHGDPQAPPVRPKPRPLADNRYIDISEPKPMSAADIAKHASTLGPKPTGSGSGGYPVMLKSIASGQVTEIKVSKIKSWGPVRAQMYEGKPYWSATVGYPTTSMFGTFNTEGMALIRGDRVIHWLYTGSGETIP